MRDIRFYASPQFLLFAAVLFFFDSTGLVSAAVPAIAVHELGHVAALHLCGCKIRKFDMRIRAFSMDYSGHLTTGQEIFAAAAGPMAGMIFAAAAHCMGQNFCSARRI